MLGSKNLLSPYNAFRYKIFFVLKYRFQNLLWNLSILTGHTLKRGLDLLVILLFSPIFIPTFIIICIAIKLGSYGPIIFKQKRVGLGGKEFSFYKFRTMYQGSELELSNIFHLNESKDGVIFKLKKDPRVTRIGRWLRKTSMDELPQIFNVIKGDMSLVGPRPPIRDEVEKYTLEERKRLLIKPGITCLWQISGRSDLPFKQQVNLDKEYIRNRSLLGDINILFKTIPAVLSGKGAY